MPSTGPEIQVACALIWRNGQIVLSKRHATAHQGSLWEFPGGKFQANENPVHCLLRELQEELGITVDTAQFMFQIPWDYGNQAIRLWVYETEAFAGEPRGLEGQRIQWFYPDEIKSLVFPKANEAIVRAIGLPRVVRIYDPSMVMEPAVWATQPKHQNLLYFRGLTPGRGLEIAITAGLERGHRIILTIDQLSCYQPGCGVHLRKTDHLTEARARLKDLNDPWPVTSGVRNESDIERQRPWPSDAVFVSPVRETPGHVGMNPLGWARFSELASILGVPAFALGGLCLDDLTEVTNHLGYGVAGIRGFQ